MINHFEEIKLTASILVIIAVCAGFLILVFAGVKFLGTVPYYETLQREAIARGYAEYCMDNTFAWEGECK